MTFSRDGKTLAAGSDDGTIRFWDVATHRPIGAPLTGHGGAVLSVAFSPDGRTLASGQHRPTVRRPPASRAPLHRPHRLGQLGRSPWTRGRTRPQHDQDNEPCAVPMRPGRPVPHTRRVGTVGAWPGLPKGLPVKPSQQQCQPCAPRARRAPRGEHAYEVSGSCCRLPNRTCWQSGRGNGSRSPASAASARRHWMVPSGEYWSPRPTRRDRLNSTGRSGACAAQSGTQWLSESARLQARDVLVQRIDEHRERQVVLELRRRVGQNQVPARPGASGELPQQPGLAPSSPLIAPGTSIQLVEDHSARSSPASPRSAR